MIVILKIKYLIKRKWIYIIESKIVEDIERKNIVILLFSSKKV